MWYNATHARASNGRSAGVGGVPEGAPPRVYDGGEHVDRGETESSAAGREGSQMLRRLAFLVTLCGVALVLFPMVTVLEQKDFVSCAVGLGLILIGLFAAIESVAKK